MWFYYSAMHMRKYNHYNLPNWQGIWVYCKDITSLFQIFKNNGAELARDCRTDFFNKWSWGFCVVLLLCQAYKKTQSEQFTLLATYLGVLKIYSLSFNDFCLYFRANMASHSCNGFYNKWSWGFCVVPL